MRITTVAVALATISQALGAYQGFNYASTFNNNAAKQQSDFEAEFKVAQGLSGAPGSFSSARLYTTVQAGTANDPISAIPAAISTKTSLLLGLWASGGDANFANELSALKKAISQYGKDLAPLVAGISVGSEDLYRISPTGILNHENVGTGPDVLAGYIKQVRDAISGTALSGASIGHVDTWTAWVNASNKATIDAVDWVGVDAYPYFEDTHANAIENDKGLFQDAFDATAAAVGGKPVWVTETGFPISGKTVGLAVPSINNAQKYWQDVGCGLLFGKTNVWWYTLHDADPTTPNPSFGIVGDKLSSTPVFDLSCDGVNTSPSSSSNTPATTSTGNGGGSGTGGQTTTGEPSSGAGGSGTAVNSSQKSIETKTTAGSGTQAAPTSSSGSGSGSGSGGSGGSGSTSTGSKSTASPTTSSVTNPNGAVAFTGSSISAAFAFLMAAILAV